MNTTDRGEDAGAGLHEAALNAAWLQWVHDNDVVKMDRDASLRNAIKVYLQRSRAHPAPVSAASDDFGAATLRAAVRSILLGPPYREYNVDERADQIVALITAKPAPASARGGEADVYDDAMAHIVDGHIVIRLPVSTLALESVVPRELLDENLKPRYPVIDVDAFAKEFVRALNREDEVGETAIHRLLDEAYSDAVDNGAEGLKYE
jgi:hypothetical protein